MATSTTPDPNPKPIAHPYGTFWQRAGAAGVDGILLQVVTAGLYALPRGEAALYASLLTAPLTWIYEVGCHARWGQTLGKLVTGIRVVGTDFNRIGFRGALLRSAVTIALGCRAMFEEFHLYRSIPDEIVQAFPVQYLVTFAVRFTPHQHLTWWLWPMVVWELAELVTMLFHPKRRAIHDLIAGTAVVQTPTAIGWKRSQRALRIAPAVLGLIAPGVFNARRASQPYRSYFPDGQLQAQYVPWAAGSSKVVIYWRNGAIRHLISESIVTDSTPRRHEKTWQTFDESGALVSKHDVSDE